MCERYLKTLSPSPVCGFYSQRPKVTHLILNVLNYVLKPRYDEQLDYVEKIITRLVQELSIWKDDVLYFFEEDVIEGEAREPVDTKDRVTLAKTLIEILYQ